VLESEFVDNAEVSVLERTVVQLGEALGLETVTEGAQGHDQRRHLISANVDTGRESLFAKRLDADGVDRLLNDWEGEPVATP
jgi:EAL domain-containing protein (putative c-di-GMP-specific phosphodiesterase class I)